MVCATTFWVATLLPPVVLLGKLSDISFASKFDWFVETTTNSQKKQISYRIASFFFFLQIIFFLTMPRSLWFPEGKCLCLYSTRIHLYCIFRHGLCFVPIRLYTLALGWYEHLDSLAEDEIPTSPTLLYPYYSVMMEPTFDVDGRVCFRRNLEGRRVVIDTPTSIILSMLFQWLSADPDVYLQIPTMESRLELNESLVDLFQSSSSTSLTTSR